MFAKVPRLFVEMQPCCNSHICICIFAALHFTNSLFRATELLELAHTNVCGPVNKESIGGAKYLLTFIDDMSRFVIVYFLKSICKIYRI